jgi:hypothetical protein
MSLLQTKLINRNDIAQFVQISKSVNEDKLNEMIVKVQISDILPLLGTKLFEELMQNPTSTANAHLLTGGSYSYNGINYANYGLKSVIIHYVDSYYKMFGDATDTPFGLVNKLNGNESKPVELATKKTLYTENKKVAYNIWQNVELYLIRTNNILFLHNNNNICKPKQTFKISKII